MTTKRPLIKQPKKQKTKFFSWVGEANAQLLEKLVREHPEELIPLCRNFALSYELKQAGNVPEYGLRKLRREPSYITEICRQMTPEAFVEFAKVLKRETAVDSLYLTRHSVCGYDSSASYRLWTAIPWVGQAGHPDWDGRIGLLESNVPNDCSLDVLATLVQRMYGGYDCMPVIRRGSHANRTDIYRVK